MLCAPSRRGSALVALFSWTLPGVIGSSVSSANKAGSIVFSLSCVRIAFFSCLTRLLGFAARRRKAGGRGRCAWSPTLRESFPVLPAARAACSRGSVDVLPQVAEFTPSLILLRLVRRRAARFCGTPALSVHAALPGSVPLVRGVCPHASLGFRFVPILLGPLHRRVCRRIPVCSLLLLHVQFWCQAMLASRRVWTRPPAPLLPTRSCMFRARAHSPSSSLGGMSSGMFSLQ